MTHFRKRIALLALAANLGLAGCTGDRHCFDVAGEPLISLFVPEDALVVEFCIDGFECAGEAARGERAEVRVDDDDRFDYTYSASVQIDGEIAEFVGDVTAEPLFPSGEQCGRSGKTAVITVIDAATVEVRG